MENMSDDEKHDYEVDDDLKDAELYLESMLEIEENDSFGPRGHEEDPFDRTEDDGEPSDLYAPTPDIPAYVADFNVPTTSTLDMVDVGGLCRMIDEVGVQKAYEAIFEVKSTSWKNWATMVSPHLVESVQSFIETGPCTNRNETASSSEEVLSKMRKVDTAKEMWKLIRNTDSHIFRDVLLECLITKNESMRCETIGYAVEFVELGLLAGQRDDPTGLKKRDEGDSPCACRMLDGDKNEEKYRQLVTLVADKENKKKKAILIIRFILCSLEGLRYDAGDETNSDRVEHFVTVAKSIFVDYGKSISQFRILFPIDFVWKILESE